MNNFIHIHGISFLLTQPEITTTFNQYLKIPMIDTPKKIWRYKVQNWYIPLDYSDDIYDGSFDYNHCGKSVFRP